MNKSRLLFYLFAFLVLGVWELVFFKIIVFKDYYIVAEMPCEQQKEGCFVRECDPAEDSTCPENVEERTSYYKLIKEKAYNFPVCALTDENCELSCDKGEDCQIILCDKDSEAPGTCFGAEQN